MLLFYESALIFFDSNYLRTDHWQGHGNTGAEELKTGVRKEGVAPHRIAGKHKQRIYFS